jgi:hypothetical protein
LTRIALNLQQKRQKRLTSARFSTGSRTKQRVERNRLHCVASIYWQAIELSNVVQICTAQCIGFSDEMNSEDESRNRLSVCEKLRNFEQ